MLITLVGAALTVYAQGPAAGSAESQLARKTFEHAMNQYGIDGDESALLNGIDEAIRLDSGQSDFWFLKAGQLAATDTEAALDAQSRAVRLLESEGPPLRLSMALRLRGQILQLAGAFESAIADYDACLSINGADTIALYCRGDSWRDHGDCVRALSDYSAVLRLTPSYRPARESRAYCLAQTGRFAEARSEYDTLLAADPRDTIALASRASVRWRLGDTPGAISDYSTAFAINPNFMDARLQYDLVLTRAELYRERIVNYQALLRLGATNPVIYTNLGWCYYSLGEFDSSIVASTKAVSLNTSDDIARYNIALATLRLGRFDEALQAYRSVPLPNDAVTGAVADLRHLVDAGIMAPEARRVLEEVFGKE